MAEIKLEDIKPNHKYHKVAEEKKEREKIPPVKKRGKIVSTKKPLLGRLWNMFVGEETPKEIMSRVVKDVIVPGLKNTVLDMLHMAFFGEPMYRGSGYNRGKTSYSSFYGKVVKNGSKKVSDYKRKEEEERVNYKHIVLDNRIDAEDIVDRMKDRIVDTGSISIAEFFDLLELPSKWTDTDWGWDDDRDIGIKSVSNGFLIDVAEAKKLE